MAMPEMRRPMETVVCLYSVTDFQERFRRPGPTKQFTVFRAALKAWFF
jgi:hypothetical protein